MFGWGLEFIGRKFYLSGFFYNRACTCSGTVMEVPIFQKRKEIIRKSGLQKEHSNHGPNNIVVYRIYMPKNHHFICLIFCLLIMVLKAQESKDNSKKLQMQIQIEAGNTLREEEGDSFTSSSLFIFLVCLLSFNLLIFVIVYCCVPCIRLKFKVDLSQARTTTSSRYPHISNFQTRPHCLIQSQKFPSRACFQKEETISELPAFILGRENEPQESSVSFLIPKQCTRCGGMTRSVEIFKYGKVRQCCEVLFMLMISPCFLAFTIRTITTNNIIWRKIFCVECGLEKEKKNQIQ